jgi:hypothetical protein
MTKYVPDLYKKNYKTLIKDIKKLNKHKNILCLWIRRLNTVLMAVLSNSTKKYAEIAIKIPASYFVNTYKLILNVI